MRRVILIGVLLVVFSGCNKQSTKTANNLLQETECLEQINVVTNYNNTLFSGNYGLAITYLDGQAKKIFTLNLKKYTNTSNLLSQDYQIETNNRNFCIVKSKLDMELLKPDKTKVLQREWIRYFLVKNGDWKIVKIEKLPVQYSFLMKEPGGDEEDKLAENTVKNFIASCAAGNIKQASLLLSGELLENSEKYKVNNIPKSELKAVSTKVLGGGKESKVISADYILDNRNLKVIYHLIKVNGVWLINDQIS